jgi:hypothetical protein
MMDPRVQQDGTTLADLKEQEELNLRIRDALSRAHRLAAQVVMMKGQLEGGDHEAVVQGLTALEGSLLSEQEPVSYPEPMLLNQLAYLYGITTGADQKPGEDPYARLEELRQKMETYEKRLAALKEEAGTALTTEAE